LQQLKVRPGVSQLSLDDRLGPVELAEVSTPNYRQNGTASDGIAEKMPLSGNSRGLLIDAE
jgi:hypothetical protein